MNADDFKIAERWNAEGFVRFGRIASEYLSNAGAHWCSLSEEAYVLAYEERKARCIRTWAKRTWRTTEEKRAA